MPHDVPILFCIFNRPELTERVFQAIAQRQPSKLLIASDGPRIDQPDDQRLVNQCRQIVDRIDWNCELSTLFQESNRGCRRQMADAISWAFQQHEELIILEDDCLPHQDFFDFSQKLLQRYREDERVMTICGINHLPIKTTHDYHFSKYPLIWGWASWRRAWQQYDLEMEAWKSDQTQNDVLDRFTESASERAYWKSLFAAQAAGSINTWDYSWTFASWLHGGLTICPRVNLVSNIGFGDMATHTVDSHSPLANQPTFPLSLQVHPPTVDRDCEWDRRANEFYFRSAEKENPVNHSPTKEPRLKRLFNRLRRYAQTQN